MKEIIGTFRGRTGLTQADLAAMLGVNRSVIAMAENGKRLLPSTPLRLLLQLQKTLDKNFPANRKVKAPPLPADTAAYIQQELLRHAGYLRMDAAVLLKKINRFETKQSQQQQAEVMLAGLQEAHAITAPAQRQANWLRSMQQLPPQTDANALLQHQLDLLRYEMLMKEAAAAEKKAAQFGG